MVCAAWAGCDGSALLPAPPGLLDAMAPAGFPAGTVASAAPPDDPLTEEKARLGRRLFNEPALSRTGEVSCASCHQQRYGFSDPRPVSAGVDGALGTRNAPALGNLAWGQSFFWDGRAKTLEEQAGQPIENPVEMGLKVDDAVARLAADADYVRDFSAAFGAPPTAVSLRQALASFVRTLVSGGSRYDQFLAGDASALDDAAARGKDVFFGTRGRCFHCHPEGALTNEGFFNNGSYAPEGDRGRQVVTGRAGDLGKFKVPGLRNVAVTAPYMHDGSLATLEEVIDQYDRGGRGDPSTDPQITPLSLAPDEKADLLAFLKALTDERFLVDARFRP